MANECTMPVIVTPSIEAIVAKLLQRSIRKPLITYGAGFNGFQYEMNLGNGLYGNVWCRVYLTYKQGVGGSSPPPPTNLNSN